MRGRRRTKHVLEPTTQTFIDGLSGPQLYELDPKAAHQVLTDLQSQPTELQDAQIEDTTWPVGPTGETHSYRSTRESQPEGDPAAHHVLSRRRMGSGRQDHP